MFVLFRFWTWDHSQTWLAPSWYSFPKSWTQTNPENTNSGRLYNLYLAQQICMPCLKTENISFQPNRSGQRRKEMIKLLILCIDSSREDNSKPSTGSLRPVKSQNAIGHSKAFAVYHYWMFFWMLLTKKPAFSWTNLQGSNQNCRSLASQATKCTLGNK